MQVQHGKNANENKEQEREQAKAVASVESDEVVALTSGLIDIPSLSGDECAVATAIEHWLQTRGWYVTMQRVAPQVDAAVQTDRFNIYATRQPDITTPTVLFNSHMDTVPPFLPAHLSATQLSGRGACDAKGLIAAQMIAAQRLVDAGIGDHIGLLFVVSEETNHSGMVEANALGLQPANLVVGEPTELKMMTRQKGILKLRLTSHGVAAHSGYPHLGRSAIDPLIDVLHALQREPWPKSKMLGATTVNIGTIAGGQAANVVADNASAMVMFRLVTPPDAILKRVQVIAGGRVDVDVYTCNPPVELAVVDGFETDMAAFNTDIPYFDRGKGNAFLIGAGSITVAHTAHEYIEIADLRKLVDCYTELGERLVQKKEQGSVPPVCASLAEKTKEEEESSCAIM